jgi:hypothetical protein
MRTTEFLIEYDLPVKDNTGKPRLSIPLQSRQIHKILDLANVVPSKKDPRFVTVKWKPTAKSILAQKGVYIWMHPNFGIFYVGIATRDNLSQRWGSHLFKLLGRTPDWYVKAGFYTKQWREFAQQFLATGVSQMDVNAVNKDLEKVRVAFYPIPSPENQTPEEYKKSLEELEDSIVKMWNPRAQGKYDPGKKTVTKNVKEETK